MIADDFLLSKYNGKTFIEYYKNFTFEGEIIFGYGYFGEKNIIPYISHIKWITTKPDNEEEIELFLESNLDKIKIKGDN